VNQRPLRIVVDLIAQAVNVNVHNVGSGIDSHLPDVIKDHAARDNPPRVAAQVFEKHEFLRRQAKGLAVSRGFPPDKVELKIADAKPQRLALRRARPAKQVAQAGKQLRQGKWLCEIVIASLLQSQNSFIHRAARRQNQDGSVTALRAATADKIEAIAVGQTEIDDQSIMNPFHSKLFGRCCICSRIDVVGSFSERSLEKLANSLVVLYKK
jgi:hypothetical protein